MGCGVEGKRKPQAGSNQYNITGLGHLGAQRIYYTITLVHEEYNAQKDFFFKGIETLESF